MSRNKISLNLKDDEVVVVAPLIRWKHLILVYEGLAKDYDDPHDKAAWLAAADWIREWINKSGVPDSGGEEDDW